MKVICLILCLALCLGGTGAAEGRVAMGRYVEAPIKLPAAGNLAFAQAEGVLYCVDGRGETLYRQTGPDDWQAEQTGYTQEGVNWLAIGPEGALYLGSGWAMVNEGYCPYVERIVDGKAQRVQFDQVLDTGTDRLCLCVLPTGQFVGLSDLEAYLFSPEGNTLQKYAVPGGTSMAVHAGELAICSTANGLITVVDIGTRQVLRTLALPGEADCGVIGYDGAGALYYLCPQGLYQMNPGSQLMVQIADGRLMTASKVGVEPWALLFDEQGNPVVAYAQEGNLSLIAYRYDPDVAAEPGTVLSVYTLYDSPTLRGWADLFQRQYPDVMVNIDVVLPQGSAVTRDDAIRNLNTVLLAGRGPDVLVLDGLPVNSYLDKGVLADLSPAVQPLIDSGALFANVAGAFKKNGALPAVPTRLLLPTLWGDVAGMNTLSDMARWAREHPEALPAYAADVEPLIGTFYLSCAPAWFTDAKQLDQGAMEAFLTALKALRGDWSYEAMAQKTGWDAKERSRERGLPFAWDWNPYRPALGYNSREEGMGVVYMTDGLQRQLPYLLRGLDSARHPNSAMAGRGDFAPLPGQAPGCYVPALMLGASKGGAHLDAAFLFIQFALGEKCQAVDLFGGLPVNRAALDAAPPGAAAGDWEGLDPIQRHKLRQMMDSLQTPVLPDFTLYDMIVQQATPFFAGQMDAEQAARNVCAKANAYLSE